MRVGSNKQNAGFESGGQDFSSEKRRQAFRQSRAPGQEVEGEVLKNLGSGLFWIDVGGLALSARLPFEARPGQRLLLRIESLEPEIMLKFVKQLHGSGGAVEVQAYTAMRSGCDAAWHEFLREELAGQGLQIHSGESDDNFSLPVEPGEVFPEEVVARGELEVSALHALWLEKFVPQLEGRTDKMFAREFGNLRAIQKAHVRSLEAKGVRGWLHAPWAGIAGQDKEVLLIQEAGQRLEKMLVSGVWPKIGGAMISALCLEGEISLRVNTQAAFPFEQAALILNLPGLGEVLRLLKQEYALAPWPETVRVTCLEYRQRPPDTIPGILLRMQG